MVSVVGSDAGAVHRTDNESGTAMRGDINAVQEVAKTSTSPHVTDSISIDDCAGTPGNRESPTEGDFHEQQPQCSNKQEDGKYMHSPEGVAVKEISSTARQSSGPGCQTKKGDSGSECPEKQHRNCTITTQATTSGKSVVSSSSMQATPVQRCGSMRRPNVTYASAARSNLTQRTMSAEEYPSTSTANNTKSENEVTTAPTSHSRQKLSKQMTVDETCSPIFIGVPDEDYLQPTTNTVVHTRPEVPPNTSQLGSHRPASVDVLRMSSPTSSLQERPQSVGVVITSGNVPRSVRPQLPTGRSCSVKEALTSKRKLLKDNVPVHLSGESDCFTPVTSQNHRTTSGFGTSTRLQPIYTNMPDEGDDLRPVREFLPERVPGVPTVVRVEKHPYAGTVPSRARQLVRSLAMCGDDDTRLRPPPPPMVNSYASVPSVGVPPRFHRNSSSLSRESSYTDYTSDLTEMELRAFIAATLHKNARDRAMILELEQLFTDFLNDFGEQSLKLPPVSSYNRMLIHRVAVLFGLDHNVDNSGKCVVVSKTSRTKPPDFLFASLIQSNIYTDNRRFCPNIVNYGEMGAGDVMQRRAQSFETGYLYPSADPDLMNPSHQWAQANHRSFEKQPHYACQMGMMDHGTMMRKAGSFSGVPAIYRSGSCSFENFDRSPMKPGQAHSLASSTHLSPREPIDETVERFNNASLSDRASQLSYRSTGSNAPPHTPVYHQYPQMVPYPVNEEVMYPPYQQQPVYMHPTTMMTPSSVEMYQSQPTIVMPLQQNPSVQQPVSVMHCPPQETLAPMPQSPLDQPAHIIPAQPEYVQYPAQQYPAQVITCVPQQYQPVTHPTYQSQYQQVIYPQQVVQQPIMQPQQYQTGFVQAAVQQPYQPNVVPAQIQQQYVQPQPQIVHVQSPVYQQQPQMRPPYPVTVPMVPQQQYVEVSKPDQPLAQQPIPYQPVMYGQWLQSPGEQYQENVSESGNIDNVDTEQNMETQVTCAPHPIPVQSNIGKPMMAPLSVLVNPEPMYHYSQTSPVMSSMQQQQMLQIQCHSRPLLYKPNQQYTAQQSSVDGGYCSMTQESLRDSEVAAAEAQ